jgi:hypothetical protein
MSWHKEFLSENQNKTQILSTLGGLFDLIEEVYEVEKGRLFNNNKTEIEILKEQFINEKKEVSFTFHAIPEISVTELGWTNVETRGDKKINGPERQQLSQFLSQIAGSNISEKVASLSSFYKDQSTLQLEGLSQGKKIAKILSYLTFYKALTKVVSNFNAASAGFNFEAFLAVLLDGQQIRANMGTIADFKTAEEVPISLKLYAEKSVVAGGSWKDLAGDLIEPKFSGFDGMRYLVCMKSFTAKDEQGNVMTQGLGVQGSIRFFQFDFTLDNVADIIAGSMDKSKKCIQLPAEFIQTGQDIAGKLPGSSMPSDEDLENMFIEYFIQGVKASEYPNHDFQPFLDALEWANNPDMFKPAAGAPNNAKIRGQSGLYIHAVKGLIKDPGTVDRPSPYIPDSIKDVENRAERIAQMKTFVQILAGLVINANDQVIDNFRKKRVEDERKQIISQKDFYASIEDSRVHYNSLESPEEKKLALENSRGIIETHQFDVNRGQILEISEDLGALQIGTEMVQEMLDSLTAELNGSIFEIFTNVKTVQDSTYGFIASGLEDDAAAERGIKASNAIGDKTEELRPPK